MTEENQQSLNQTPPAEDTSALKKALDETRKEADKLKAQLRDREEKEALASKSLAEQVSLLQQEKQNILKELAEKEASFNSQLQRRDITFEFTRTLTNAGVLPNYEKLLLSTHASDLEVKDGKVATRDGKPLADFVNDLRTQYSAMFQPVSDASGDGATGSTTNGKRPEQVRQVSRENFMSNLSDIASGKARLK